MRWAIVSDIHANLEALEAVLADLEREHPESLVCLGDFVGYGASPNECIARLRPRLAAAVAGNHDFAAVGRTRLGSFSGDAATAARWTGTQLTPEHRDYLLALPLSVRWRDTLLVHASPALPESWAYVLSPLDAEEELEAYDEELGFIGHSHYPGAFIRDGAGAIHYTREAEIPLQPGCRYLVNVPSVGQPRDGDARAGYLIVDEEARALRQVRVPYDVGGAMRRIRDAGLPRFLSERLMAGE
jgi:diadenosine tetraphosphatase ApaH/serine/threonine PP2A family protein phosphatase